MMVVRVQAVLMRLGIYDGDIDGLLGPKTRSAIQTYQRQSGMKATGTMDLDTLTRMGPSVQSQPATSLFARRIDLVADFAGSGSHLPTRLCRAISSRLPDANERVRQQFEP